MRIEVLCTGDELTTGLIVDTNSAYFLSRLFALGEKVQRVQVVGDVREDITRAILEASTRAEAVLVSGGLGPTADDFTAECAAKAAGVPLVEDAGALAWLQERFVARGLKLTPNNARQALVPQGSEVVRNLAGSAPMFILRLNGCSLFFVPGVPREYQALVDTEVLPRLRAMVEGRPDRVFRAARLLKTVGLAESHLDAKVMPLAPQHPRVVFGFRTHAPENHLKLMAEAPSQAEADSALAAATSACAAVLEPYLFGVDGDSFPAKVGQLLSRREETLAAAESLTGGVLSALITEVPGSSAYFRGGAITYQDDLKTRWAGVTEEALRTEGAVSRVVAKQMAEGIRAQTGATYGVALTGFAGPGGGTAEDPVGTVYCALSAPEGVECERHRFLGERDRIRAHAAYAALDLLRRAIRHREGSM